MRNLLSKPGLWGSAVLLLATNALNAEDAASSSGISLFDLVSQGGWAMYPLGFLMLAMFYLVFHCHAQTAGRRFTPPNTTAVIDRLRRRDVPGAIENAASSATVLGRLMAVALSKARLGRVDANREGMEAAFVEAAEGEENTVSQWINYLNVIATVAPMVGLLGTVSGMIGAFQKIGQGGMGKPDELAGNIGEALITTATGLVIGIPAMIAYFYFRNRLTSRMIEVGQTGGVLLDHLEDAAAGGVNAAVDAPEFA